ASAICALWGLSSLNREETETDDYLDSHLPPDAFLMESRIGHDYGYFAAVYWQHAIYEGNPQQAEAVLDSALRSSNARSQIQKAQAANFFVAPDPKRDAEIMRRYWRI